MNFAFFDKKKCVYLIILFFIWGLPGAPMCTVFEEYAFSFFNACLLNYDKLAAVSANRWQCESQICCLTLSEKSQNLQLFDNH